MDTMKFICQKCSYIYDPQSDLDDGMPFKELPGDWLCPKCFNDKSEYIPLKKEKPVRKGRIVVETK
jgi:rubredoxin